MPFTMKNDTIDWYGANTSAARPILTSSTTASYVSYSVSSVLPVARIYEIAYGATTQSQFLSIDGVNTVVGFSSPNTIFIVCTSSVFIKNVGNTDIVGIYAVKVRR